ncbi:unnamed protein product [Paramecium sonneborni]|uniref:Uncharacterized protein n=1 Tax=Paramecium sonneborni TaxID=65129 RepID=A0A8S1R339_9CILI|nr:unnamed protein product [Paramecium sonneborni]
MVMLNLKQVLMNKNRKMCFLQKQKSKHIQGLAISVIQCCQAFGSYQFEIWRRRGIFFEYLKNQEK